MTPTRPTVPPVPDDTAERVALWRAAHVTADGPPHVLVDELGRRLVAPGAERLRQGDLGPASARARASVVVRSRIAEDAVAEAAAEGTRQYVVLGAGLDTFAQREAASLPGLRVYEVDRPAMQAWKRRRLAELDLPVDRLTMVPVDVDRDGDWVDALVAAGFDRAAPAVVSALGMTQYVSRRATASLLRQVAALAPGSRLVLTVSPPAEAVEPAERHRLVMTMAGAAATGHPWIAWYTPAQITALAVEAGLRDPQVLDAAELGRRYFAGRADGLRPSSIEAVLTARTG